MTEQFIADPQTRFAQAAAEEQELLGEGFILSHTIRPSDVVGTMHRILLCKMILMIQFVARKRFGAIQMWPFWRPELSV
jgi:hypothetical protein